MVRVRKSQDEHMADMAYLLDEILDLNDDRDYPIRDAISYATIATVKDLLSIEIDRYEYMKYRKRDEDNSVTLELLPDYAVGTLKSFKQYVQYLGSIGTPVKNQEWQSIDPDDFDNFCVGPYNRENPPRITAPNPAATAVPPSMTVNKTVDKVKEFKKGIRRDPTLFKELKRDADYHAWRIHTEIQASAQGVESVLDPNFTPDASIPGEEEVFEEQQKYMMGVLASKLMSNKAKQLIRQYAATHDAQKILEQYHNHCTTSMQADDDCACIQEFLLTTKAEDWPGSMLDYFVLLRDKAQEFNEKAPTVMTPAQIRSHIERAVANIPDLGTIKQTARQLEKITSKPLTLQQYFDLLEDACITYDVKVGKRAGKQRNPRRSVYQHDVSYDPHPYQDLDDNHEPYFSSDTFDLDSPLYEIQKQVQTFNNRPRLPRDTWFSLGHGDQRSWDNITDEGKRLIMEGLHSGTSKPSVPSSSATTSKHTATTLHHPYKPPPKSGITHHIRYTDADYDTFEAFCAGRSSSATEVHHVHHQDASDNEGAEDLGTENVEQNEELSPNNDELYAYLTNRNKKPPAQSIPKPGNVNRLMSKAMEKGK